MLFFVMLLPKLVVLTFSLPNSPTQQVFAARRESIALADALRLLKTSIQWSLKFGAQNQRISAKWLSA